MLPVSHETRAFLFKSQSDPVEGPKWKAGIATLNPAKPITEREIVRLLDAVFPEKAKRSPQVQELKKWFLGKLNPNPSEPVRLMKLLTKISGNRFTVEKKAQRAPSIAPQGLARPRVDITAVLASDRPTKDKWQAVVAGFAGLGQDLRAQGAGQIELCDRTVALEQEIQRYREDAQAHVQRAAALDARTQALEGQLAQLTAALQGLQAADQGLQAAVQGLQQADEAAGVRAGNVEVEQRRQHAATLADIQLSCDTAVQTREQLSREYENLRAERAGLWAREEPLLATGITSSVVGGLGTIAGGVGFPVAMGVGTSAGASAASVFFGVTGTAATVAAPACFATGILALPVLAIGGVLLGLRVHEQKKLEKLNKKIEEVEQALREANSLVARWAARNAAAAQLAAAPQPAAQPAQPAAAPQPAAQPAQPAAAPQPAEQPAQPAAAPQPEAKVEQAPAAKQEIDEIDGRY